MVAPKDSGFVLPEGFVDECVEYEEEDRPVVLMWWRYLLAFLVILIVGYLFYFLERTKQRPRHDEDESGAGEPVKQLPEASTTSPISAALETPYRIVTETNVAQTITIKLADLLQQINLTQIFAAANTEHQQATVRRSSQVLLPNATTPVNESWDMRDEQYTDSRRDSEEQPQQTVNETDYKQHIAKKHIQQQQAFDQTEAYIYVTNDDYGKKDADHIISTKTAHELPSSSTELFPLQERPASELEFLHCTTPDEIRPESFETNSSSSPFEEIAPSPRSHVSSSGDSSTEIVNNDQLQAIEKELQDEEEAMLGKHLLTGLHSPSPPQPLDNGLELNRSLTTPTNELFNNQEQAYFAEENINDGFIQVTQDADASVPIYIDIKPHTEFSFGVDEHSPSPRTLPTEISELTEILLVPKQQSEFAADERQLEEENIEHIEAIPAVSIAARQQHTERIQGECSENTPNILEQQINLSTNKTKIMDWPDEQQQMHENIAEIPETSITPVENREQAHEFNLTQLAKPKHIEEVQNVVLQQSGSLDWPDGHVKEKLEFDHYEFQPIGWEPTSELEALDLRPEPVIYAYAEQQQPSHFTSETVKIDNRPAAPETSTEINIKLAEESPTVEDSKDILEELIKPHHPFQPQFAPCSKPSLQTREAKPESKRPQQHKEILSSLQQLQDRMDEEFKTTAAAVETAIQKPSDIFQLSAIEIIEPNEKAEETVEQQQPDGAIELMKASSSHDEKRLHIPARKGSRPKIMDFQESLDTTDAPSFSEQFEKLSSLLEPTKLHIISPPPSRKARTKSKSKPKSDKTQQKRPQTPSSLRACGVTSTQEALLKVQSLEELSGFMKQAGLERTNLIFGIDYTASNKYQGEVSFGGRCLHELSNKMLNPYQQVIRTMGRTLAPFATSGIIPAFGFGDQRTTDWSVFPLKINDYCKSFDEVLRAYNEVTPTIVLAGPTNFAPLIYQSIEICRQMRDYHILVIVADGQVTNERATRRAIVDACKFPLSIVMVGVGDGPWDMMHVFDESLPKRPWDNFHFIDFNEVVKLQSTSPEVAFAVQSLLEIPDQYKRIKKLGLLNFA